MSEIPRVTSDCRPYPPGGRLGWCEHCSTVQAILDERWMRDTQGIYQAYDIFHQSAGAEQAVFDADAETFVQRSELLLRRLAQIFSIPRQGQILDIGCGSGETLRSFSRVFPHWHLDGFDLDTRMLKKLRAIPGWRQLHTDSVAAIDQRYDLVSMIHCLEHVPEPVPVLRDVLDKLGPAGKLFIQVPDTSVWHFDMVVADHSLHFDLGTLAAAVEASGFSILELTDVWSYKELSLVAKQDAGDSETRVPCRSKSPRTLADVHRQIDWLRAVIDQAQHAARGGNFGIFGTSISAAWLYGSLGEPVEFFVDEDPSRIGREFMGRPVLGPSELAPMRTCTWR